MVIILGAHIVIEYIANYKTNALPVKLVIVPGAVWWDSVHVRVTELNGCFSKIMGNVNITLDRSTSLVWRMSITNVVKVHIKVW